jgi:hypothetical protein
VDVDGWIARAANCTTRPLLDIYKAIDDARQLLKWTYPYAYLLPAGSLQLGKFEARQGNLERTHERLVRIVEQPSSMETPEELDGCMELLERYKQELFDEVEVAHARQ